MAGGRGGPRSQAGLGEASQRKQHGQFEPAGSKRGEAAISGRRTGTCKGPGAGLV